MRLKIQYIFHYTYGVSMNYTLTVHNPYYGIFSFSTPYYPQKARDTRCDFDIVISRESLDSELDFYYGLLNYDPFDGDDFITFLGEFLDHFFCYL